MIDITKEVVFHFDNDRKQAGRISLREKSRPRSVASDHFLEKINHVVSRCLSMQQYAHLGKVFHKFKPANFKAQYFSIYGESLMEIVLINHTDHRALKFIVDNADHKLLKKFIAKNNFHLLKLFFIILMSDEDSANNHARSARISKLKMLFILNREAVEHVICRKAIFNMLDHLAKEDVAKVTDHPKYKPQNIDVTMQDYLQTKSPFDSKEPLYCCAIL